jgi:hypothetical protein
MAETRANASVELTAARMVALMVARKAFEYADMSSRKVNHRGTNALVHSPLCLPVKMAAWRVGTLAEHWAAMLAELKVV